MVRGSASEAGGCGFDTRPRHTKDVKNGTSSYLDLRSLIYKANTGFSPTPFPPPPHDKISKINKMTSMIE